MEYPIISIVEAFAGGFLIVMGVAMGQNSQEKPKRYAASMICLAVGAVLMFIGGTGIMDAGFRR